MSIAKKRLSLLLAGIFLVFSILTLLPLEQNKAQAAVPFTVALHPGHGPASSGSGAVQGTITEAVLNEQLTAKISAALRARGIGVLLTNKMTSVSDPAPYVLSGPPYGGEKQYSYLTPKAEILGATNCPWVLNAACTQKPDLAVSVQHNSYSDTSVNGNQVFYSSTIAGDYGKNSTSVALSKAFAQMLDAQFRKPGFYLANRSVSDVENNSLTKYSGVPSVLLEAGFMSNASDFAKMQNSANQQMYAERFADAVVEYKNKYQSTEPPKMNSISTSTTPSYGPTFSVNANVSNTARVYAAVWSASGNQSDLKWYDMTCVSGADWSLTFDLKDFGYKPDSYNVHLYATGADGNGMCVGATAFTLLGDTAAPTADSVRATLPAPKSSTFIVSANGVKDDSGVSDVRFAVWTEKNGQDDLRWYSGANDGSGNWSVSVNAADHNNEAGVYVVHAYATDAKGNSGMIGYATLIVDHNDHTPPTATGVSTSQDPWTSLSLTISASGVTDDSGVAGVQAAVWSEASGQGDLRWYSLTNNGSGNWSANVSMKDFSANGLYNIHYYATDTRGNMGMIGHQSVTSQRDTAPPASQLVYAVNTTVNSPSFTVVAHNVSDPSGVSNVQFAVWTERNGQDDIRWYQGNKLVNDQGSHWLAQINAINHNDEAGTYIIHAYGTDELGNFGIVGYTTIEVTHRDYNPPTAAGVSTSQDPWTSASMTLSASGVTDDMSGVKAVRAAVWSAANGQSDLRWYHLSNNGAGNWSANANMADFSADGEYTIHYYAEDIAGNVGFIGAKSVNMQHDRTAPTAASVQAALPSQYAAGFTASATGVSDASGVMSVQFAVWTESNGQDDIRWYAGTNDGNGNWSAQVNAAGHRDEEGLYNVHAYATDILGNFGNIGAATVTLDHKDTTAPTATGVTTSENPVMSDTVGVHVEGVTDDRSGVAGVRIAMWSNVNGQDDLRWYTLTDRGGGFWATNVRIADFSAAGPFTIHAYATDKSGNDGYVAAGAVTVGVASGYTIMGASSVTAPQLAKYYTNAGGWAWDASQYGGSMTLEQFCQLYIDYCAAEGVKAEVAFAQMCLETNFLKYGNLVTRDQWNFAGLGATGAPNKGIYFKYVEDGVLSQVQHLKAYACTDGLNLTPCAEYNRFGYVTRGCAPTVQALSGLWASDTGYGAKILGYINAILNTSV